MKYNEPKINITSFHSESVLTDPASVASADAYIAEAVGNNALTVNTDSLKDVSWVF